VQKRESFLQSFGAQAAIALDSALSEKGQSRQQLAQVADDYREATRRVVHEVNNPLSIIKNYLSVLDHKLAQREPVTGEMSILNEEIDRVGQLISGLADLKPDPDAPRTADLASVADEVIRLFRATAFIPDNIEIVVNMHEPARRIDGDPDVVKQILVNLVKNAIEALAPRGGRIDITNRGHINRDRKLYLELVVSDTGPGLPADVLAKLFSEVSSNKRGPNHGLGLSIVDGLVKQLGGQIACRSSRAGTSFEILLPAHSNLGVAPTLRALGAA
jgi:signal transduction histidine kinase